ncbi:MAG: Sapep family Mn(2+)-dependent dipeptidase [Lachnospiraceae bacterium]|nr:Sapep family Mn(2+)-dependent dipeptidase [Lachnospiraceae bacterium]
MDDEELKREIDAFVDRNRDAILTDLDSLIRVPSVKGDAAPGAPFGSAVRRALDTALGIAGRMGFDTADGEGYMGWADLPGESEAILGLAAHLDVVPAGGEWLSDPFTLTRKDGFLIGRGVADDKGPAVLMLYTALFLKELCERTSMRLPYRLRVLFGCNEETGMKCVQYYTKHYEMPAFCFTPDATFPVNYGEKGGMRATLVSRKIENGTIRELAGGEATNAVAGSARALLRGKLCDCPARENITVREEGDCVRITATGKPGHAAEPEKGVNAIALLVNYMLDYRLCTEEENVFLRMQRKLLEATDGSNLGIAAADTYFTPLTCIGGKADLAEGHIRQSVDVRFPTTQTAEKIEGVLRGMVESAGGTYEKGYVRKPFLIDPESDLVQVCVGAYEEITGRKDKLLTTSGGTYAHNFSSAICFGMEDPQKNYPEWVGDMHCANEGTPEAWLFQSLKVYILATLRLMRLQLSAR